MGMRPNSTALSEMGSHLGGRSFHASARICQLSQLGWWYWEVRSILHVYVSVYQCTLSKPIFAEYLLPPFQTKMAICMGRTLFPSMASIALPWTNIIENLSKQLHFYFVSKQRGGEKWHEVKNSKNLGYNPSLWLVFTGVSGRFLTLQQISVYVKACGWRLTQHCNDVTIVIGHDQQWEGPSVPTPNFSWTRAFFRTCCPRSIVIWPSTCVDMSEWSCHDIH